MTLLLKAILLFALTNVAYSGGVVWKEGDQQQELGDQQQEKMPKLYILSVILRPNTLNSFSQPSPMMSPPQMPPPMMSPPHMPPPMMSPPHMPPPMAMPLPHMPPPMMMPPPHMPPPMMPPPHMPPPMLMQLPHLPPWAIMPPQMMSSPHMPPPMMPPPHMPPPPMMPPPPHMSPPMMSPPHMSPPMMSPPHMPPPMMMAASHMMSPPMPHRIPLPFPPPPQPTDDHHPTLSPPEMDYYDAVKLEDERENAQKKQKAFLNNLFDALRTNLEPATVVMESKVPMLPFPAIVQPLPSLFSKATPFAVIVRPVPPREHEHSPNEIDEAVDEDKPKVSPDEVQIEGEDKPKNSPDAEGAMGEDKPKVSPDATQIEGAMDEDKPKVLDDENTERETTVVHVPEETQNSEAQVKEATPKTIGQVRHIVEGNDEGSEDAKKDKDDAKKDKNDPMPLPPMAARFFNQ